MNTEQSIFIISCLFVLILLISVITLLPDVVKVFKKYMRDLNKIEKILVGILLGALMSSCITVGFVLTNVWAIILNIK